MPNLLSISFCQVARGSEFLLVFDFLGPVCKCLDRLASVRIGIYALSLLLNQAQSGAGRMGAKLSGLRVTLRRRSVCC